MNTDLIVKTHKLNEAIVEFNEELTEIVDLSNKKEIAIDADKYKILDSVYDEKLKEISQFVFNSEKKLNGKNIDSTNSQQSTSSVIHDKRNNVDSLAMANTALPVTNFDFESPSLTLPFSLSFINL